MRLILKRQSESIRKICLVSRVVLSLGIAVCFATAPSQADDLLSNTTYGIQYKVTKEISVNSTDHNQPPSKLAQADTTSEVAARYGATVRNIESNGITLRIVEAGAGPLVVLVHGWRDLFATQERRR